MTNPDKLAVDNQTGYLKLSYYQRDSLRMIAKSVWDDYGELGGPGYWFLAVQKFLDKKGYKIVKKGENKPIKVYEGDL